MAENLGSRRCITDLRQDERNPSGTEDSVGVRPTQIGILCSFVTGSYSDHRLPPGLGRQAEQYQDQQQREGLDSFHDVDV